MLSRPPGRGVRGYVQSRLNELASDPRAVITHMFTLTVAQKAVLLATTDVELQDSFTPLVERLREGYRVVGVHIEQVVGSAELLTGPAAKNQIVITIGKGRCKITITLDL